MCRGPEVRGRAGVCEEEGGQGDWVRMNEGREVGTQVRNAPGWSGVGAWSCWNL